MALKNYGGCHKKQGNLEEAENQLEKAERVAERELEENHMCKVMVKTELVLLYEEEEGKEDQMKEAMKEGLQMCYKLDQTVERLSNKREIREFLDRDPKTFPVEKYPR